MSNRTSSLLLFAVMIATGCGGDTPATGQLAAADVPPVFVDSVFPVEEEIRRFKAMRSPLTVSRLEHGAPTRDALVDRLLQALETRDSTALSGMVLSAAEFIDLYYPASIYARPPYKQSPELLWLMLQQNSQKGIGRALDRFGGMRPRFESYECQAEPVVWGENRLWQQCAVRWAPTPDAPSPLRLFGGIIERQGHFKFITYANDL